MLLSPNLLSIRNAKGDIVDLAAVELVTSPALAGEDIGFSAFPLVPLSAPAGSTGKDYSVNAPEAPLIGSFQFGGDSQYALWFQIQNVPANTGASERVVCNNSQGPILVALDDGSTDGGTAPIDSSVYILYPYSTSSPNPEPWRSERFKGRIRIFAPTQTAWVTISEA